MVWRFRGAAWVLLLWVQGAAAADVVEDAVPETPERLVARAFANLYADDYVQRAVLATSRNQGRELRRTVQLARKQTVTPGKALVRFTAPQAIRRTSVLILENEAAYDDLYVFLPALDRTRRIGGAQRADSFFGTDLSFEDLEPKRVADWHVAFLRDDEAQGLACRVVELVPRSEELSTYERMVSCIEPERALILWTDFFRRGRLDKHMEIDATSVRVVGRRHIPFELRFETPRKHTMTRLATEEYRIRDLPDRLFTTVNLEAGDADSDLRDPGGS